MQYTLGAVTNKNLSRFSACWVPTQYGTRLDGDCYVIGLIYIEPDAQHPDGEFGYFESQLKYWSAKGRWSEISEFDYDETTGDLTIKFDNGYAVFSIDAADHLHMSNYGGSYEFYRAPND